MSDTYYSYREVKVLIAHRLFNLEGWTVYGYHADRSDSYSDYWDPALWGGIATKNGYTLVVDHSSSAEEYRRTYTVKTNYDPANADKIAKLEKMTQANGASAQEEATAKAAIKKLMEKEAAGEVTKEDYTPGHLANPPRCNWHIEKDGIIYDKGTGLLKYAGLPDITHEGDLKKWQDFNNKTPDEWKKDYAQYEEWHWNATPEKAAERAESAYKSAAETYKLLEQFNILINRFNAIAGGMVGNETDGYKYEMRKVTKYKTVYKFVEDVSGSFKPGQCFKLLHSFNYGCYAGLIYKFQDVYNRTRVRGQRVSLKSNKVLTGTANSANSFGYYVADGDPTQDASKEKFLNWIKTGAITWGHIIEVQEPYEVEKAVKVRADGSEYKPTKAPTEATPATKYIITEDTDTRDNSMIYVVKLADRVSRDDFLSIRKTMQAAGGYYSRFKSGFIFKEDPTGKLNQEATEAPQEEPKTEATPEAPQEAPEFTTGATLGKLHTVKEINGHKYTIDAANITQPGEKVSHYEIVILDENDDECEATTTPNASEARMIFYEYCEKWQPGPTKASYGYTGKTSDFFTPDEIKTLEAGGQIAKGDGWQRKIYIATPYENNILFVYGLGTGNTGKLSPTQSGNFTGFIYKSAFYNDLETIEKEAREDINTELTKLIPNQKAAEKNAAGLEDYEQKAIEEYRNYAFESEIKNHFIDDTKPDIYLYTYNTSLDSYTIIDYIVNPAEVVKARANEYKEARKSEILKCYLRYNIVIAGIKAIKEDKTNPLHLVKKIRKATTGGNEKTFKILLANGHTVKAEADAVRRLAYCGGISSYHINCSDRQYLNQNEYKRPEDIKPADIIQISHGSRILYTA